MGKEGEETDVRGVWMCLKVNGRGQRWKETWRKMVDGEDWISKGGGEGNVGKGNSKMVIGIMTWEREGEGRLRQGRGLERGWRRDVR